MIGEYIDKLVTYGTAGFIFIKPAIEKLFKHPELAKAATDKIIEIAKNGRTHADELLFFASLISLSGPDASEVNKMLFLEKHSELCLPDLKGKSPNEIRELRRKEGLAKGLVFLIAENNKLDDKKQAFKMANQVWYGIFMGIKDLHDDPEKLALLEKRILHFGKNNQEGGISGIIERIHPYGIEVWGKIGSVLDKIGLKAEGFKNSSKKALNDFNARPWWKKMISN